MYIMITDKLSRELIIKTNTAGIIKDVSANCFDILGYKKKDLLKTCILEYTRESILNDCKKEISFLNKDNSFSILDTRSRSIYKNNKRIGFCYSMINVSEYKEKENENKTIKNILKKSRDIIYRLEIKPEIKLTYLSPSIEEQLGYKVEQYYKNPMAVNEKVHPDDYNELKAKLSGNADYSKPIIIRYKHKEGNYIWFEEHVTPIYNEKDEFIAIEGISRNIQERKELEEKLTKLSYRDSLTGLYNRTYFNKELEELNNEKNMEIGVIVCDLDDLKLINDRYGHLQGDKILKKTGELLKNTVKDKGLVARVGGDEFVILLRGNKVDEINNLHEKLKSTFTDYNNKSNLSINISIGFSYNDSSLGITDELFNIADNNMYIDKRNKRDMKNFNSIHNI
ncbi:MAG: diguanylate cyclase [Firmicutes bacterium]|nr:diguanylate cyclase [Bacillota bacterium]